MHAQDDRVDRVAPKLPVAVAGPVIRPSIEPAHLKSRMTRTEDLFVLAHLAVPEVDEKSWSLEICGRVGRNLTISFADLLALPKRSLESFIECAGNPFNPTEASRQIANVKWGGADLKALLNELHVDASATHLWAYGLEHGAFAGDEVAHYIKDLPLSCIEQGDVLIAYELNDEPLSAEHGFPARLVVPGYYGTNNVKWLCRLELADRRAGGLFTTKLYNDPVGDGATRPVWEVEPESMLASPAPGDALSMQMQEIWGRAWSGAEIVAVEVSFDGGTTWEDARVEPRHQRSWQRFSIGWLPPEPGEYDLRCRARDAKGRIQPESGARNAIYSVKVVVSEAGGG